MFDADERELFERSLTKAVESTTGAVLDAALDDIGWRDALAVDPRVSVSALFDAQGRAGVTSSAIDWLLADGSGLDSEGAMVLPAIGSWDAPARVAGEGLTIRGLGAAALPRAETMVVVVADGDGYVAHRCAVDARSLRGIRGLDEAFGLVEVSLDATPTDAPQVVDWVAGVALAQLGLAHELTGASRTMLRLAREHALERIQFGRPIARFQAVRHRLAETLIAIETAEAAIDGAWRDGTPYAAAVAKAVAGQSARTAARHCQQVLAGIGFTAEHPLHGYIRRVLVLDGLLGDAKTLTRALGEELLRTRRLPPMLAL